MTNDSTKTQNLGNLSYLISAFISCVEEIGKEIESLKGCLISIGRRTLANFPQFLDFLDVIIL